MIAYGSTLPKPGTQPSMSWNRLFLFNAKPYPGACCGINATRSFAMDYPAQVGSALCVQAEMFISSFTKWILIIGESIETKRIARA